VCDRDCLKGKVKYAVNMSSSGMTEDAPAANSFNPPYVHSVAISPSGRCFAAGVGDGSVAVHELSTQRCVQRLWAHSRAAGRVEYPSFIEDVALRETMLVSSGNDGRVLVTDVQRDSSIVESDASKRKGKKSAPAVEHMDGMGRATGKRTLYAIDHGSGPNWFTTSSAHDGSIIVSDPTSIITVYSGVKSRVVSRVECPE
jgi:hypothetical protein